jgi:lipoyl(octanoyl) transferase
MLVSMRWHFTVTTPSDGAANMALDEALLHRAARTGDAVFRVYGWSAPTLSLGRNQRARGLYNLEAAAARGVGIVRRPTGGRALLHHREITYSATLPVPDAAAASAAYDFINDVLLDGLRSLGVQAELARKTAALPPGPRPCFDVPADREIVCDGRKLVGSAQWRTDGALLQHGSILVRDDQPLIAELMSMPTAATVGAATLSEPLGRDPTIDEVAGLLSAALRERADVVAEPFGVDDSVQAEFADLRASYADERWTWRR